ncbi:hypothetical protein SDC9_202990 [bioreactor metagenome]|uniref:Uncharacterized protein n=1 Tax=bioreactor metagenome TaxID=1076179 RepID=A0A645IV65_9ZZZZ
MPEQRSVGASADQVGSQPEGFQQSGPLQVAHHDAGLDGTGTGAQGERGGEPRPAAPDGSGTVQHVALTRTRQPEGQRAVAHLDRAGRD